MQSHREALQTRSGGRYPNIKLKKEGKSESQKVRKKE
jgi:hypothetical protein